MARTSTSFRKGVSGNPAGRRPGVPDRRRELRELIRPHVPELIEQARALAKAGDAAAIRLLLDRALPPLKPTSEAVAFDLPADASLADQARAILAAIAAGKLDPVTGRALVDALASVGRLVEVEELTRRIEALEEGNAT